MPVRRGTWVCSRALASQAGAGLFQRARMPSTTLFADAHDEILAVEAEGHAILVARLGRRVAIPGLAVDLDLLEAVRSGLLGLLEIS